MATSDGTYRLPWNVPGYGYEFPEWVDKYMDADNESADPAPASAEPVVNAAAMAALEERLVSWRRLSPSDDRRHGAKHSAKDLECLLATFTVRELGGEVRDD